MLKRQHLPSSGRAEAPRLRPSRHRPAWCPHEAHGALSTTSHGSLLASITRCCRLVYSSSWWTEMVVYALRGKSAIAMQYRPPTASCPTSGSLRASAVNEVVRGSTAASAAPRRRHSPTCWRCREIPRPGRGIRGSHRAAGRAERFLAGWRRQCGGLPQSTASAAGSAGKPLRPRPSSASGESVASNVSPGSGYDGAVKRRWIFSTLSIMPALTTASTGVSDRRRPARGRWRG